MFGIKNIKNKEIKTIDSKEREEIINLFSKQNNNYIKT